MASDLPESAIRLLIALEWWIALLSTAAERMGEYLDDQLSTRGLFESHPMEEIERYFTEDQIDRILERMEDRVVVELRLQADALFIAGALYQVDGFLGRLARLDLWRGELASTGNRFREIYKEQRLKDLRNMIEHADEHIAFDKSRIAKDFDMGFGLKAWGRASERGIGVETMYLFGNEYEVLKAVEAARAVGEHIEYEVPESMLRRDPPWT